MQTIGAREENSLPYSVRSTFLNTYCIFTFCFAHTNVANMVYTNYWLAFKLKERFVLITKTSRVYFFRSLLKVCQPRCCL